MNEYQSWLKKKKNACSFIWIIKEKGSEMKKQISENRNKFKLVAAFVFLLKHK